MTITPITVESVYLTDLPGDLDPIHVFWQNLEPGRGYCTLLCYGSAWTVYFGGMSGKTIQEFFRNADTHYLVGKMGNTPQLKATKRDNAYLYKIIEAVKAYLATEEVMPV